MRVLELGNYILPAYAGMILAEQGADVIKWHNGNDPILSLQHGQELWQWINDGKLLQERSATSILDLHPASWPDIVLDNFRPATLEQWGIDPPALVEKMGCVWVSMCSEVGAVSFDIIAQCRSWLEYGPYLPFYVGDTAAGLWMAFKALSMHVQKKPGHYVLGQATCLQKLVEGELVIERPITPGVAPWDMPGTYFFDDYHEEGVSLFKNTIYREPVRTTAWKLAHLWHENGRMRI